MPKITISATTHKRIEKFNGENFQPEHFTRNQDGTVTIEVDQQVKDGLDLIATTPDQAINSLLNERGK